jgi:hypothetical protein
MATFSQLPTELVEYIYAHLTQPDLYAVCQVNNSLHTLAIPFLYRHADLSIKPSSKLRRIDWFCMNVSKSKRLAARVETIRLGPTPEEEETKLGQRWLPPDRHFDDNAMYQMATKVLDHETLVSKGDYFRDALLLREYAAYATLILMVLPSLCALHIADFDCSSLDHLHTVLRSLKNRPDSNRQRASASLLQRLSSITDISFNIDRFTGIAHPNSSARFNLEPVLNLTGVQKLELSIPDVFEAGLRVGINLPWRTRSLLSTGERLQNITKLVIRHSGAILQSVCMLFEATPQLLSFTYDFFYDNKERSELPARWLDLSSWNDALPRTLHTLVLAVENCDTGTFPFKQPRIGEKLFGYLDLTSFTCLHTLEVPFPFLTGDVEFSITSDIYALLPPNLRHLSLRTDLSQAQHQYPIDTSRLPKGLTFEESRDEARHMDTARMDVSYMFHATMLILEFATSLESIAIWQPADASLSWFDGQVTDFAQTCRNKSISGLVIYPMVLRWKHKDHWDLVKEVTVFDPSRPMAGHYETLCRGERNGIPLGLASQLHLHALHNHQCKLR